MCLLYRQKQYNASAIDSIVNVGTLMPMKPKTGRPRKTPAKRKTRYLQVRVTDAEKGVFDRAAELAGIDTSAWVRERLRMIAREELADAGETAEL